MRFTIKNPPHLLAITSERVSRYSITDVMFVAGKNGGRAYAYATDGRRVVAAPVDASAAAQDAVLPRDAFKPKVKRVDVSSKVARINGKERAVEMPSQLKFPPIEDVIPRADEDVIWIALNAKFLLEVAIAINSVAHADNEFAVRIGIQKGGAKPFLVQSIRPSAAIAVLMPVGMDKADARTDWNLARGLIRTNLGVEKVKAKRPRSDR